MKRLPFLFAATALTAPIAACTDTNPYDGEEVKSDDGKADSSAAGIFLDAQFDGKLLVDSSWDDRGRSRIICSTRSASSTA